MAGAAYRNERTRWWLYLLIVLPLLSRIRKEELAEPDKFKAGRIYQAIFQNPGVNLKALRSLTELKNGTLIYHLDRLEKDGQIRSHKLNQLRIFYPAEEAVEHEGKSSLDYLGESQKRIVALLNDRPDATQRFIMDALRMKQPLVSYHLRELLRNGHIRRRGLRGFYTYRVAGERRGQPRSEG